MTGNTIHNDNVKSIYGTSSDGLEIFHDGGHSYITDTGTGSLFIQADASLNFKSNSQNENWITATSNGKVDLWYNGSRKFETTNTGVAVTGNAALSTGFSIPDNQYGKFGIGDDIIIGHDSTNSIIRSSTGDLFIDQAAVTKSMIFRVSNANALDTTALTINREGDLTTGADVTIAGNLTVNGTTTTINTQTLAVEDPLIELSKDNSANSVDIGFYGKYNDGTARYLGLFSDASDSNKFRLFKGTTVQPTTTVNIAGSGYVAADLQVAGLEATTITTSGTVSVGNTLYVTEYIQHLGNTSNNIRFTTDAIAISANATFAGNVILGDSSQIQLGTGNDAQIDHTGSHLFIDNSVGNTYLRNTSTGSILLRNSTGGDIQFDNEFAGNILFNTSNVTRLTIDSSGNSTFAGDVSLANLKSIYFGTSSALRIYTDSAVAYLRGNDIRLTNALNQSIFRVNTNVAELYYSDSKRFETTAGGTVNTGTIDSTGTITVTGANGNVGINTDSGKLLLGASYDLQIYHDGNDSYISDAGTGLLFIRASSALRIQGANGESMIDANENGAVNLYYDNSIKFATTSTGVSATGEVKVYSGSNLGYFGVDTGNSYVYLGSNTSGYSLALQTSGTNALTIDSSGNATFAGTINSGSITSTGGITTTSGDGVNAPLGVFSSASLNTNVLRFIKTGSVGYNWQFPATDSIRFGPDTGTDKKLSFTNSGAGSFLVGIGTDNPARNLTIYESSGNAVLQLANSTSGVGASDGFLVFTDGTNVGLENKENGYLSLSTQAIERMRVSADGKVTIGNTAAVQPLTVAGNVLFRTSTADGFENRFQFIPGGSGDAGNFYVYNASETATIRLNANGDSYFNGGNVGIGGSSTGAKLEIIGGGYNSIRIGSNQTANTNKQSGISMNNYEGNGTSIFQTFQQNNDNSIYWGSGDAGFRGVQNHYFMVNADSDATTNHITAMRITSGGLLFVGDTTTNYGYSAHHIANDASQGYALILRNSNTSTTNNSVLQLNQAETTSTTQGYLIIGRQGDPNSGTNRFFVYSNGDVKNQNNSYGAISDERLKENIVDATPKLDDLMKVKIRNYNFIGQEDKQIGVIAQEIENVFPNLVEDTKDPENEENTKSVKYSVLVPIMLKAIQELKAEVELLKQECKCK